MSETDLEKIAQKIKLLRQEATELKKIGSDIPAVEKNVDRILASIRMLEINISDLLDLRASHRQRKRG